MRKTPTRRPASAPPARCRPIAPRRLTWKRAKKKRIQADIARMRANPPPPITIANGGAVVQIPQPGGYGVGQGLVVNNTQLYVNIQNGSGNVAANTVVSSSQSPSPSPSPKSE
jgi:hypothetical protein